MKYICILFLMFLFAVATSAQTEGLFRTHGLKINVDDMDTAILFYVGKLGFEIEDRNNYPNQVSLKTNDRIKLILHKVKKLQRLDVNNTRVGLSLQVNDLDKAIERMKAAGMDFGENQKRKEGVGFAISFKDPFGRTISIMHVTIRKVEPFQEPKIYNYGVLVPDMDVARAFYGKKLGFVERSQQYLPLDMPLGHTDKTFGFMLHVRSNIVAVKNEYPKVSPAFMMMFETADLQKTIVELEKNGIKIVEKKEKSVIFEDSFGNVSEVVQANEAK